MPQRIPYFKPKVPPTTANAGRAAIIKFRNSKAWRSLSQFHLREFPLCAICKEPANQTHHLKPVAEHWDLRFDPENLSSRCQSCHSKETMAENRAKGNL
ncbi:HNH endonuclease [Anatilimnocola floriformis]|uniref:HNH endonuclease n=1 Tax=Anatilimnocola floriformis TaxID=2948575 RepID=UPI0020C1DAC5|nr:HNH endonuclease [Anatilimnocola floriformis]